MLMLFGTADEALAKPTETAQFVSSSRVSLLWRVRALVDLCSLHAGS